MSQRARHCFWYFHSFSLIEDLDNGDLAMYMYYWRMCCTLPCYSNAALSSQYIQEPGRPRRQNPEWDWRWGESRMTLGDRKQSQRGSDHEMSSILPPPPSSRFASPLLPRNHTTLLLSSCPSPVSGISFPRRSLHRKHRHPAHLSWQKLPAPLGTSSHLRTTLTTSPP